VNDLIQRHTLPGSRRVACHHVFHFEPMGVHVSAGSIAKTWKGTVTVIPVTLAATAFAKAMP
jgi:hypothetical protein